MAMPGTVLRCPHCGVTVQLVAANSQQAIAQFQMHNSPNAGVLLLTVAACPLCKEAVVDVLPQRAGPMRVYPDSGGRAMPPNDVPPTIQKEYIEAARVEPKSLRAAAALARRCLQSALRAQGFRAKRLVDEIEMAEKDSRSTATLVAKLHMLREIGNYAAHPTEDAAGTIVDVEPGEVDVLFDALDELFDVFWVKPEVHKKQLAALNAKLVAAGKKPIS